MKSKEAPPRPYVAIPLVVLQSTAFQALPGSGKTLLIYVASRHTGSNNGRITLPRQWIRSLGFTWNGTTQRALNALIDADLVVRTRIGKFEGVPAWYALTWLPISDFSGMELSQKAFNDVSMRFLKARPQNRTSPGHKIEQVPATKSNISGHKIEPDCTKNRQFAGHKIEQSGISCTYKEGTTGTGGSS